MKIGAFGSPNIIELLDQAVGSEYEVVNINYKGVIPYSRKHILSFFIKIINVDILYSVSVSKFSCWLAIFAKILHKKVIFHWIGTDVLNQLEGKENVNKYMKYVDLNLAYSENLQEELKSLSINSEILTLVPKGIKLDSGNMPKSHAVLLSIPDINAEFYGYSTMMDIIKKYKNLKFYIVRSEKPELYNEPNVVFMGMLSHEQMDELYNKVSIVIRYPKHDGLSLIMMESTIKGKEMIYKFYHPYSHKVSSLEDICFELDKILENQPKVNHEASLYGIEHYNIDFCHKEVIRILDNIMKKRDKNV